MNELREKVRAVERDIAAEKGPLNLFALFEREDLFDRWDLVVSAPWAKHDRETLGYVVDVVKRHLESAEMTRLARIVILDATTDPVRALTERYSVEDEPVELSDLQRFGLPVTHGFLIASRPAA